MELTAIRPLAWGSRVSHAFRVRIRKMAVELLMPPEDGPDYLMACIAWESGETFSPSILNKAGSGAVGLIQFMPATAKELGVTTAQLADMTAEQQLEYVAKYFRRYKGKLNTLSDVYMAILWPRAIGAHEDAPLWDKASRPTTYRQNSGLDVNKDAIITKREAASKIEAKLRKGRNPDIALA
jgi:hypothetical protein